MNYEAWRRIDTLEYVLNWIRYGVKIPFGKTKPEKVHLPNCVYSDKHSDFIDGEINWLLAQGAIRECFEWKSHCVLAIKCVPKKKKLHMILDYRFVNSYMSTPDFKQEGIESVADLIQDGDEIITVDLKDGFQHVPVHISSRHT